MERAKQALANLVFFKFTLNLLFLFLVVFSACSSKPDLKLDSPSPVEQNTFKSSQHPLQIEKAQNVIKSWEKKFEGVITDLEVSSDGKFILLATRPEPEITKKDWSTWIRKYDDQGKLHWQVHPKGPVKDLAISAQDEMSVVTGYDDSIYALGARGKILWQVSGQCRPYFIESISRILCYHDDDADSDVAFHLLDYRGRVQGEYYIKDSEEDILGLKLSQNQNHLAIALTNGKVHVFKTKNMLAKGAPLKPEFTFRAESEVLDLAVFSDTSFQVAAVTSKNEMIIFTPKSDPVHIPLDFRVEQVEWHPKGQGLVVYGNLKNQQKVQYYQKLNDQFTLGFTKQEQTQAEYSSFVSISDSHLLFRFLKTFGVQRINQIIGMGLNGEPLWSIPVYNNESVYVLKQEFLKSSHQVLFYTDDGQLQVYHTPKVEY